VASPTGAHYVYLVEDEENKFLQITETSYAILTIIRDQPNHDLNSIISDLKNTFNITISDEELQNDVTSFIKKLCDLKVIEEV
jgi:hypothetical protein